MISLATPFVLIHVAVQALTAWAKGIALLNPVVGKRTIVKIIFVCNCVNIALIVSGAYAFFVMRAGFRPNCGSVGKNR